jgi:hypothetical protein
MSLLFTLIFSFVGFAVEPATTSSFDWSKLERNFDLSYASLVTGPTLEHLDANKDGKGTDMGWRNYLNAGAELGNNWEASMGVEGRQYFRPADPKKPNRKDFEWRDPTVSLSRGKIVEAGAYQLSAKLRYSIPMTEYNKSNVGKTYDAGNGEINLGFNNSWRLRDGDWTLSLPLDLYYKIAEAPPAVREDYSARAKAIVAYRIAAKYATKVEYSTGYIRHSTNGKWSKLNDKLLGQEVLLAFNYFPIRNLTISPGLGWGSETFRFNSAKASLYVSYNVL